LVFFWEPILGPMIEALGPRVVVEVGVHQGDTTARLAELAAKDGFVVHAIDPAPATNARLEPLVEANAGRLVFHPSRSLEALPRIEGIDVALLDGDHNWYTVHHELGILEELSAREGRPYPLTFVHDVGWPYGRRDLYYDPDAIPDEYRHPYRKAGIVPGVSELSDSRGFNARANNAIEEGTPRNGIRTAIEDFLAESRVELVFRDVVGLHGLAILVAPARLEENDELRRLLDELQSPAWLREQAERIEQARLAALSELG
jgi:hypothetical protein